MRPALANRFILLFGYLRRIAARLRILLGHRSRDFLQPANELVLHVILAHPEAFCGLLSRSTFETTQFDHLTARVGQNRNQSGRSAVRIVGKDEVSKSKYLMCS